MLWLFSFRYTKEKKDKEISQKKKKTKGKGERAKVTVGASQQPPRPVFIMASRFLLHMGLGSITGLVLGSTPIKRLLLLSFWSSGKEGCHTGKQELAGWTFSSHFPVGKADDGRLYL